MRSYTTSMKLLPSTLAAFALYSATVQAQETASPSTPPPTPPAVEAPDLTNEEAPAAEAPELTPPPAPAEAQEAATPTLPGEEAPGEAPAAQEELEDGMRLNDAELNTVFEVLARDAGLSYFHNNRIAGDEFKVNGYLKDGDALTQMDDLAFNNALTLHRRGNTIYALTSDQLSQLPATEWSYQLKYLRSANMKDHIRELVSPLLSPNTGIVNYEEKTNTLIIIDTPYKIERVKSLLERIDRAKGQIVVEVKIFRVIDRIAQELGTDWSASLGADGGLAAVAGINSLLGLPIGTGGAVIGDPVSAGDLVFSPDQISGVIRALNDSGVTKLQNNPVLITEDNETANISIIDRIPIITSTTTSGTSTSTSEEVRYRIDEDDPTDPELSREIGTTIAVTPTLLPDGTIRLKMRPRAASVTEFIVGGAEEGATPNRYPRVLESSLTTIARIPDGHSLIVGGFFSEQVLETNNKVPLLGDIPVVNFFFKSKSTSKEKSSLIFVVTPSSYSPQAHASHHRTHNRIKSTLQIQDRETTFDDPCNNDIDKPNLQRTWNNMKKESGLNHLNTNSTGTNRPYRIRR